MTEIVETDGKQIVEFQMRHASQQVIIKLQSHNHSNASQCDYPCESRNLSVPNASLTPPRSLPKELARGETLPTTPSLPHPHHEGSCPPHLHHPTPLHRVESIEDILPLLLLKGLASRGEHWEDHPMLCRAAQSHPVKATGDVSDQHLHLRRSRSQAVYTLV